MSDRPTTSAEKHPGGRPSKYDPAYCDQVVEFCRDGYSLTAFAGSIGVARSTIQEWSANHPEFSVACNAAKAAAAYKWEQRAGRVGDQGGGPGTAQIVVFQLRNMAPDDFREKVDHTHSGPDGGPIRSVTTTMTPQEAADTYAATLHDRG